jgi:putative ABC transport system substrate-binding protein
MRRRDFALMLSGAAMALPLLARAQPSSMPLIGYLGSDPPGEPAMLLAAFRQGLGEAGYADGRNVSIEFRWADNQYDRLTSLAEDLVSRHVTVIAAPNTVVALAAKRATATIPIVFTTGNDPVKVGLVGSLARPEGNITGVSRFNVELAPKRLELLHEMVPTASVVGVLVNPGNPNADTVSADLVKTGRALGLQIHVVHASAESDFDRVFARLHDVSAGALVIGADPFFNSMSERIASLTIEHALPTIYQYRKFVEAGGLISYSASLMDSHRQLGVYVGQILSGAKPADLPVQQSTKVELIINLKTARALGLNLPLALLARADEVIE